MSTRRIRRYVAIFLLFASVAATEWVVAVGPVTAYRTVVYNFSGIDDYRIFPQRRLTAAPVPFRFRDGHGRSR